ncbi:amidohydrolase family protein [Prosthecobacter sp.]|uniref:amidohydrolase family protein n=1 Tax=Prosthecobacter sp. TaxID=1965333 RepID=UPI002ABC64BC|nr:amidohydrolase family protein [Prosthecobacter sp.]MDZ4402458.1 amidohydrolase family protein [Prosthecobacter sp.]
MKTRFLWALGFAVVSATFAADMLRPPGLRPLEASSHALVGARVVTSPGKELEKGTIILREGRIVAVGAKVDVPKDARVHDMTGTTIYAGFIDAHVSFAKSTRNAPEEGGPPVEEGVLTSGAAAPFLGVNSAAGGPGAKSVVTPERRMAREHAPSQKSLDALRHEGFTAANVVPDTGVIRGVSTFVSLASGDPDVAIIRPDTFQHVSIDSPRSGADEDEDKNPRAYPASLMGVIAVVRQTFLDARHQAADHAHYAKHAKDRPRPAQDSSLEALLPAAEKKMPVLFEPASVLMVERAVQLAREFDLQPALLACGQEWRRPELARAAKAPFIVPLDFPEVAKLPEDDDWLAVPFETLRAWDHAPSNAALLPREGVEIALTTHGLAKRSSFRTNARLAIARGLSTDDALAALTTVPAKLCGVSDQLGTIEAGKLAHLTVVEKGGYFDEDARVREVWIDGRQFQAPIKDDKKDAKDKKGDEDEAKKSEKKALREKLTAAAAQQDRGPLLSTKSVLVKNATIWTCGPKGRIENANLLITNGKITHVGLFKVELAADTLVIDIPGIHITPGLIDCHSHSMIMGGVNEGTLPSTAMVRVEDVVNSESETIHQQLAGGLTTTNLLHGSANPIGGQNCVIKLRDGAAPEDLKFKGAPGGIKFALGENVKQSGWGDAFKSRFPQSRMGVPAFHANRFTAAQQYMAEIEKQKREGGPPVRRDLELETIAEIIRGERLVHCHSYRQDEILAFLRVMEGFKVRVGTLQHILEGYKVADEIAKHGAGASAFSDWWAYKLEVYDAIPHAGSIMRERGVLVSFNSDSSDHARRLNLEAAKAVKYGGTSEEEALKFVTLNPAKQLRIDKSVGSLEVGKDGDFVIWSGHPLSTSSICLQTWIEGKQYFEREAAKRRADSRQTERLALIAKAKKIATGSSGGAPADDKAKARFFFRTLEERQNHLCVDCCMERSLSWEN